MPHPTFLIAAGFVLASHLAGPAFAQQAPLLPLAAAKIDKQTLATGARASRTIGSSVTNEVSDKLVVVPCSSISTVDHKLILPALPEYTYSTTMK